MKTVIVRSLQNLVLFTLAAIAALVIALGSLSVSEVERKVNEYETQHRSSQVNDEGQHRAAWLPSSVQ